ncbi:hypothetical protein N0V95_002154 [Ascochyta clinopodiicola]|nr:hypothetical protein N0V95_002154 [Ascochyta clinopodiicola]
MVWGRGGDVMLFVVPGPATVAQIERENKARDVHDSEGRAPSPVAGSTPTPSRLTPSRLLRTSLSADSPTFASTPTPTPTPTPTSLKKSLDLFRPSPPRHSPSRSLSARSSPVLARASSHDPSPKLFRTQTSRELRPEYQRATMSFAFNQSASAPAANVGADVPVILAEVPRRPR